MGIKQKLRKMAGDGYRVCTLHFLYPFLYRRYAAKPVKKNKVVFLEVRQQGLSDNFQMLYEQLEEKKKYDLKVCFIGEGMQGYWRTIRSCLAVLRELADAEYIFVNDSSYFTGCLPLRKETQMIQTWHACGAFKKFGYSTAGKKFGTDRKQLDRFPLHRNYSFVTVSSPEVVWAYAEAFHMESEQEKILPIGISRTDCFYRPENIRAAKERLKNTLKECLIAGEAEKNAGFEGKKVILYAPTFRGKVADAQSPEVLDFRKMREALGEDYLFLCKHHPFVKKRPQIPEECRGYALDVTDRMSIEDLLMVSDVCISDYSSLVFEYSLFERPMIFLAPDLEEYYDWRGFYYSYQEMAPGPVVKSTEEVIRCLQELEKGFDRQRVRAFRERFMSACDGHATERLIQLIEDGEMV